VESYSVLQSDWPFIGNQYVLCVLRPTNMSFVSFGSDFQNRFLVANNNFRRHSYDARAALN
jgi:hypothetical protein